MKSQFLLTGVALACCLLSTPAQAATLSLGTNTLSAIPFAPDGALPGTIQVSGINQVGFIAETAQPGVLSFNYQTEIIDINNGNFEPVAGSLFTFTASDLPFSSLSFSSIFNFAPGSGSGLCPVLTTTSTTYNCGAALGNPALLIDGQYTARFSVELAALLDSDPEPFTVTAVKFAPFTIVNGACVAGCGGNPFVPEPPSGPFAAVAVGLVWLFAHKKFRPAA